MDKLRIHCIDGNYTDITLDKKLSENLLNHLQNQEKIGNWIRLGNNIIFLVKNITSLEIC